MIFESHSQLVKSKDTLGWQDGSAAIPTSLFDVLSLKFALDGYIHAIVLKSEAKVARSRQKMSSNITMFGSLLKFVSVFLLLK